MQRFGSRSLAIAVLAALLLPGCATHYRLDNQVQSFSGLPALPASPTYRFERLPSQAGQPGQEQLEALADPALFRAGLRRDDAAPRYSVQLSARVQRMVSPWGDPFWGDPWGWGGAGFGLHGHRASLGFGFGAPFPRPEYAWFQREVAVVMRELATQKVVYETRAVSAGPLIENRVVLAAMFDAALQGFPNPPQGPRQVNILLGGDKQQAAVPAAPAAPAAR